MKRPFAGLLGAAGAVLHGALAVAAPVGLDSSLALPTVDMPAGVELVSVRVALAPGAEGTHHATATLAFLNGASSAQDATLGFGIAGPRSRPSVSLRGEDVPLAESSGRLQAVLHFQAGEAAVAQVGQDLSAELVPALTVAEAGWWGATRGALLQPMRRLGVKGTSGLPAALVEIRIDPGDAPLASALFPASPAALSGGAVTWWASGANAAEIGLAWPTAENEAFLPADGAEADAFLAAWHEHPLAAADVRLVRLGLRAAHGLSIDDPAAAQALASDKRPYWATIRGDLSGSERAAAERLEAYERALPPARPTEKPAAVATTTPATRPPEQPPVAATPVPAPSRPAATPPMAATPVSAPSRPAATPPIAATPAPPAQRPPEKPPVIAAVTPPPARPTEPAPVREPETVTEPVPASPAPTAPPPAMTASPTAVPAPPVHVATPAASDFAEMDGVPYVRSAMDARLFLAREREAGPLDPRRLRAAMDLIEAHAGKSFPNDPAFQARLQAESWYVARRSYSPERLPQDAREALALLRNALTDR